MYVIKMNGDKSLQTTVHANIYEGEKNADMLVFLIPKIYGNQNLADCELLLRYILPNGYGKSEALEIDLEPYNENYYRYNLSINTRLTDIAGDIELWLSAISLKDNLVFKTDSTYITIQSSKEITEYLSPDDRDQLNMLSAKISKLEAEKADNIFYDESQQFLQLSSCGQPIGDKVDMSKVGSDDEVIDFDGTIDTPDDADSVIYF